MKFIFPAIALGLLTATAHAQNPTLLYTADTPMSAQISQPNASEFQSETSRHHAARLASNALLPSLALGELILLNDKRDGRNLAMRGAGAQVTTFAATLALKKLFHQKRRERDTRDSFPSGHTALGFAMASTLGTLKPSYAVPAYAAATTIGLSRLELHEHRPRDVIAGAILGFAIGRAFSAHARENHNTPLLNFGFGW